MNWDDRSRSTEVDVDLEEEEIEVVVKETTTFSDFFNEDNELRLWQDNGGWSGVLREDGAFWRVNVMDDGEIIAKDPMSAEDVVESIRDHVEDPGAGSVGSFITPSRPGSHRSDPSMVGDRP
ncbi:hypothetical protein GJ633_12695 [Halorubrum sp. CBA1125]|uniref:hypothetical protein n=1 Tax=Halorubrum sp. CBA1125 TaxID=2668072 RepID=UPI0012E961FA|nr:hypothetical protein [Halorubrum sp. CBA1125]MUW15406.1 hypothetical protein [Halorubrum sp. CBA1125]